jgi:hypothetical protein
MLRYTIPSATKKKKKKDSLVVVDEQVLYPRVRVLPLNNI